MTSDLQDILEGTFRLCYALKISPLEVDKLTTYEMREYLRKLDNVTKTESEESASLFRSIAQLLGLKKKL